jgi:hypothetical protein
MSGQPRVYAVQPASGATVSTAVQLGHSFRGYALEIPTMASGTDIYLQGSTDEGTTYRRIYFATEDSSPVVAQFPSSVTNGIYPIVGLLPDRVRVEFSTAITATSPTIKFICLQ